MSDNYSGCEIIELGIQIEKNGFHFYTDLSKKFDNDRLKKIFDGLANAERRHIELFNKLEKALCDYTESPESYPQEYFEYMHAMAKEHIFTKENKGSEIAKKISSDVEAVEMALSFEKDSIKFYQEMKKVVPEKEHYIIDILIEEEEQHYKDLSQFRKTL